MENEPLTVSIICAGGFGTTIASLLKAKGLNPLLWSLEPEIADSIMNQAVNERYLPGMKLTEAINTTVDLSEAVKLSNILVMAIPTSYIRETLSKVSPQLFAGKTVLSVAKGVESSTGLTPTGIIQDCLTESECICCMSGPNLALEILRNLPSASVIAGDSSNYGQLKQLQNLMTTDRFRVYTSTDLRGVEFCGAVKNIYAIGAGICDGLGYGVNTKAAFLTRCLYEMIKLSPRMGADSKTVLGLSGSGDLFATSFSPDSRNRKFGERIGSGLCAVDALASTVMVTEGYHTTGAMVELLGEDIENFPIIRELFQVLFHNQSPAKTVSNLMNRELKSEFSEVVDQ